LDRLGRSSRLRLDPLGRRATNSIPAFNTPDTATNRTVCDALGRVACTADARGTTNALGYTAAGRRTATTNAWGTAVAVVSRFVDAAVGSVTINIDALNRETATVDDCRGRWCATLAPALTNGGPRLVSGILYDSAELGRRGAGTNAAGLISTSTGDGVGRLLATTNGTGTWSGYTAVTNWARFQYDTAGYLTNQIDALNRSNHLSYDALGRRIGALRPNGQLTGYRYDWVGNQISMTNADLVVITYQFLICFATLRRNGFHPIAAARLVDPARPAALRRGAHPSSEDVADPEGLAVSQARHSSPDPARSQ